MRWVSIVLASMWTMTACASLGGPIAEVAGESAEKVVRQATRPAIREVLLALNEPRSRALIVDLVSDPAIAAAVRDISSAAVGGALDALLEPERQARLREATRRFITEVAAATGDAVDALGARFDGATRDVAQDFVIGLDDGLTYVAAEASYGARPSTMLSRVEEASDSLPLVIWLLAIGFGLVLVGLVVWVVILMRRLNRRSPTPRAAAAPGPA